MCVKKEELGAGKGRNQIEIHKRWYKMHNLKADKLENQFQLHFRDSPTHTQHSCLEWSNSICLYLATDKRVVYDVVKQNICTKSVKM